MFTDFRSGVQSERFRRCILLPLNMKWKKKVSLYNSQWFSAVKVVLALATAAAIGTMMPPTPVSLTVTTRRTLMRIAITITACGLPKPLSLYV
jgi:hypothetical protein